MDKIDEMPLKKSKQLWGPLGIRVISLLIVFITIGIFLVGWGVQHREKHESIRALIENANITNKTPAVLQRLSLIPRAKRSAEQHKEGLEILIPRGEAVTVSLDVCDVVVCGEMQDAIGHDVYGCIHAWGQPDDNSWCPNSEKVYWSARAEGNNNPPGLAFRSQLSFFKGHHSRDSSRHNPIIIAFKSALTHSFEKKGKVTAFHLIIGIEVPGKDPLGSILVKIIDPPPDVIPDFAPKYTDSMFQPVPEIPPTKSVNNRLMTYLSTTTDNSGIEKNPLGDFFDGLLGKYKNLVLSGMISITGVIAILSLCCCCCITCIRTLANRLITTALTREHFRDQFLMRERFQMLAEIDSPAPYADLDLNDEIV